jgi:hypothetical protein
MNAKITTGAGDAFQPAAKDRTFQAVVVGTGAVTATVAIEVSNDGTYWETLATINLSGTTSDSDGLTSSAPWGYVRANVTAISGTNAAVTVKMGV